MYVFSWDVPMSRLDWTDIFTFFIVMLINAIS